MRILSFGLRVLFNLFVVLILSLAKILLSEFLGTDPYTPPHDSWNQSALPELRPSIATEATQALGVRSEASPFMPMFPASPSNWEIPLDPCLPQEILSFSRFKYGPDQRRTRKKGSNVLSTISMQRWNDSGWLKYTCFLPTSPMKSNDKGQTIGSK